eukprot:635938-Pleurochrysis_carterae.AAC.2
MRESHTLRARSVSRKSNFSWLSFLSFSASAFVHFCFEFLTLVKVFSTYGALALAVDLAARVGTAEKSYAELCLFSGFACGCAGGGSGSGVGTSGRG